MELLTSNVVINGQRIACGIHGEGNPIILIHGTPSHSYIWRNVAPALEEAGYRVHLFDLLGFGRSERPRDPSIDTSVSAQIDILRGLMTYWKLDSAHIVSHDIGGAIGMRFAIFYPKMVQSLTLIDTVSYDSWPSVTWRERIKSGLEALTATSDSEHRKSFGDQILTAVYNKEKMKKEALAQYLEAISGPIGQASFFQHQVRHYDSRHTEEIDHRLQELAEMPVQIIWGENDSWQTPDGAHRLHGDIPGSTLHILAECGHFAMEDKPAEITNLIKGFIAAQSA